MDIAAEINPLDFNLIRRCQYYSAQLQFLYYFLGNSYPNLNNAE